MTRTAVVATALAVVTGYSTWGPVTLANAASLSGSSFEVDNDADLVVDAGGIDWTNGAAMRSGVLVKHDTASGASDTSFTGGTHESTGVPTVETGSIPPQKSDLKDFGVYKESAGGKSFLNVFWTRVQDPQGDTNMDFEFNQSPATKNDPAASDQVVPVRTDGDLLLTYDLSNGGATATISKRFWSGNAWGAATPLTGAQALGTINSSTIAAADSGGLGSLGPRTFGEASVDLSALLPAAQGCVTYGSAYLKSRASDAFNAELKDFVAPESVTISNCGAIQVHKTDGAGAALAGAGFTLDKDLAPVGGALGPEDTVVATRSTDASGNLTFTDVPKGDYWVHESTVPAGHDAVADQQVSITAGDQLVTLNLDDPFTPRTDLGVGVTALGSKAQDDLWTITKAVDQTRIDIADGGTATFHYQVTVAPNGHTDGAYALAGSVHVTNPNTLDDISADLTVTATVGGGASCTVTNGTGVTVPKAGSADRAYSCTFSGAPAAGTVTATASWDATAAHTPHSTATGTAPASFPVGTETHKTVTVVDDKTDPAHPVTLGTVDVSQGSTTFSYTLDQTGVAGKCTDYTNTASLTETKQFDTKKVTVCVGQDLLVSNTASATAHRTFLWDIAKSVDATVRHIPAGGTATFGYAVTVTPTTTTDSGWTVTGRITVHNPNSWQAVTADVADTVNAGGGGACTIQGSAHVTVPASGSVDLDYSCSFTSQPTNGTNTATATWNSGTAHTPTGSDTGSASLTFVPTGSTNETITVVDDKTDPGNPVTLGTATWGAGPKTFTYSLDKSGTAGSCADYTNTATITQTGQSASRTVTVCVGSDLTATATADGAFSRDDLWSISKTVDKTTAGAADGTAVTFHYTVTATPSGFADSGYALGGSVTVSNPNGWESVTTDTAVTTDLGGGATCTVTDGTGHTVPAGGSVTLAYSCAFSDVPALTGTVTATTTWDGAAASTPSASATATADATLAMTSEAHASVTVVDDKTDADHPVTLGTASWADAPTVFRYDLDKTAAGTTCTTYTNVAQIAETQQTASQDVAVCGQFTGGGGTITEPTKGGGSLVFTGSYTALMAELAAAGLAFGALLVMVGRRRRS